MSVAICALCGAVQGGTAVHEATCPRALEDPEKWVYVGVIDGFQTWVKPDDPCLKPPPQRALPAHCWDCGRDEMDCVCDGSDPRSEHPSDHISGRPEATRDAPHLLAAPETCPHCVDETDCGSIATCRAVDEIDWSSGLSFCRHDLPDGACGICKAELRDELAEPVKHARATHLGAAWKDGKAW